MISLHRSRVIVAATVQEDGSVLVLDPAGHELTLSAEAFAAQFAPATVDEVRRINTAHQNSNGAVAIEAPVRKALPAPKAGTSRATSDRPKTRQPRAALRVARDTRKDKPDGRRSKVSDERWNWAADQWKKGDLSIREIADRLGVKDPSVHYQAKARHWGKRPKGASKPGPKPKLAENPERAATPSPAAIAADVPEPVKRVIQKAEPIAVVRPAAPKKEDKTRTALRRCDTCGSVTERDPCNKCGRPMEQWKGVFEA